MAADIAGYIAERGLLIAFFAAKLAATRAIGSSAVACSLAAVIIEERRSMLRALRAKWAARRGIDREAARQDRQRRRKQRQDIEDEDSGKVVAREPIRPGSSPPYEGAKEFSP